MSDQSVNLRIDATNQTQPAWDAVGKGASAAAGQADEAMRRLETDANKAAAAVARAKATAAAPVRPGVGAVDFSGGAMNPALAMSGGTAAAATNAQTTLQESLKKTISQLGQYSQASDSAGAKLDQLGKAGLNVKGAMAEMGRAAGAAMGHLATGAAMAGLESVKGKWREIEAATDEANAAAERVGATYAKQSALKLFAETWLGRKGEDGLAIAAPTKEEKVAQDNAAYALEKAREKAQMTDRERDRAVTGAAEEKRLIKELRQEQERRIQASADGAEREHQRQQDTLAGLEAEMSLRDKLTQSLKQVLQARQAEAQAEQAVAKAVQGAAQQDLERATQQRLAAATAASQAASDRLAKLEQEAQPLEAAAQLGRGGRAAARRQHEREQRATDQRERELQRAAAAGERTAAQGLMPNDDHREAMQIVRHRGAVDQAKKQATVADLNKFFAEIDAAGAKAEAQRLAGAERGRGVQGLIDAQRGASGGRSAAEAAARHLQQTAQEGPYAGSSTATLAEAASDTQRRIDDYEGKTGPGAARGREVKDAERGQSQEAVITEIQGLRRDLAAIVKNGIPWKAGE